MKINNPRYPDTVYIQKMTNYGSSDSPVWRTARTVDTNCRVELNKSFMNSGVLVSKYSLRMDKVSPNAQIRLVTDKIFATIHDGKIEGNIISIEHTNFQTLLWFNADYVADFTPPTNEEFTASIVTASVASSVTETSALLGGNVTSCGNTAVTQHGFYWSATHTAPDASDHVINLGARPFEGAYTASLTGLVGATTYYVRAFSTNLNGMSVSSSVSFTTLTPPLEPTAPILTTNTITTITAVGATFSGTTTRNGLSAITAHGFVYSATETTPTLANATEISLGAQSTVGAFNSVFSTGSALTIYYVRAYATNAIGTSYGDVVSFETIASETVIYETSAPEVIETGYESASVNVVFTEAGTYHIRATGTGGETDLAGAEIIVWNGETSDPTFYLDAYGITGTYIDLVIPSAMTAVVKIGSYYATGAITISSVKIIA